MTQFAWKVRSVSSWPFGAQEVLLLCVHQPACHFLALEELSRKVFLDDLEQVVLHFLKHMTLDLELTRLVASGEQASSAKKPVPD